MKNLPKYIEVNDLCGLNELEEGERCIAKVITAGGSIRRRLLDIGVTEGTKIRCVRKSLSGDPAAYEIRGALIALRNDTAALIRVERLNTEWQSGRKKKKSTVFRRRRAVHNE